MSDKEIQDGIRSVIRQITASVTFLPLLDKPCEWVAFIGTVGGVRVFVWGTALENLINFDKIMDVCRPGCFPAIAKLGDFPEKIIKNTQAGCRHITEPAKCENELDRRLHGTVCCVQRCADLCLAIDIIVSVSMKRKIQVYIFLDINSRA